MKKIEDSRMRLSDAEVRFGTLRKLVIDQGKPIDRPELIVGPPFPVFVPIWLLPVANHGSSSLEVPRRRNRLRFISIHTINPISIPITQSIPISISMLLLLYSLGKSPLLALLLHLSRSFDLRLLSLKAVLHRNHGYEIDRKTPYVESVNECNDPFYYCGGIVVFAIV